MLLNVEFRLVPMLFTATMITMEIPAAIRQYSMAVAPDSLFKKRETMVFISLLLGPCTLVDRDPLMPDR